MQDEAALALAMASDAVYKAQIDVNMAFDARVEAKDKAAAAAGKAKEEMRLWEEFHAMGQRLFGMHAIVSATHSTLPEGSGMVIFVVFQLHAR